MWLRAGRGQKNMTLDDVARVTKIQSRILERLEAGKFDGLPAEVFVRGFVRSFARCIGLDEDEAIRRYTACTKAEPPPSAKAFVESMSDLAPASASSVTGFRATPIVLTAAEIPVVAAPVPEVVEVVMLPAMGTLVDVPAASSELVIETITAEASSEIPVVVSDEQQSPIAAIAEALIEEPTSAKGKKKKAKKPAGRSRRKSIANGTPAEPTPIVAVVATEVEPAPVEASVATAVEVQAAAPVTEVTEVIDASAPSVTVPAPAAPASTASTDDAPAIGGVWSPKMPVAPAVSTAPWRISRGVRATSLVPAVPSLVIDDSDPDSAEREIEDRAAAARPPRARSFLPPILLDREDRSGRQGGLTLAVIILLIAATLTLSYLMRRPSSSGDGVTARDTSTLPLA